MAARPGLEPRALLPEQLGPRPLPDPTDLRSQGRLGVASRDEGPGIPTCGARGSLRRHGKVWGLP